MDSPCDKHIQQAAQAAEELLELANQGDAYRDDDGCGILFGVVRDCAYKILREAERERLAHMAAVRR